MVQKFKRKTRPFEAIQYNGNNGMELDKWSEGMVIQSPVLEPSERNPTGDYVQIKDLKGGCTTAVKGEWVCKDITGEFFSCSDELFKEMYEPTKSQ